MAIQHLIILRYMATVSQFSNFHFRGEAERENQSTVQLDSET